MPTLRRGRALSRSRRRSLAVAEGRRLGRAGSPDPNCRSAGSSSNSSPGCRTTHAAVLRRDHRGIGFLVDGLTAILLHIPALVLILAIAALAYWLQRSWKLALFVIIAFLLITNLGYWKATVQTISLVGFSTLASVAIGVPLGIASAHRPWLYTRCGRCSI